MTSFLSIPAEIREIILNKLTQTEVLDLRYVCNQLKEEVLNLYKFNLTFQQDSGNSFQKLKTISNVRIKSLEILHKNPNSSNIDLLFNKNNTKLKYPKLHSLSISDNRAGWGTVQPPLPLPLKFLHLLLKQCSEHLKQFTLLHLSSENLQANSIVIPCTKYNFKNLTTITLSNWEFGVFDKSPEDGNQNPTQYYNFYSNILKSVATTDNLKQLKFDFIDQCRDTVATAKDRFLPLYLEVFKIILQQWKTLESIEIKSQQIHPTENEHGQTLLTSLEIEGLVDFKILQKVNNLRKFEFTNRNCNYLPGPEEIVEKYLPLWGEILKRQKKLEILNVFSLPSLTYSDGLEVLVNNYITLSVVIIYFNFNMEHNINHVIDLRVFENSKNLKTLHLSRWIDAQTCPECELVGMEVLPESIVELRFQNFKISKDSLKAWSTRKDLGNLEILKLHDCGNEGSYGLTTEFLESVLLYMPKVWNVILGAFNLSEDGESEKFQNFVIQNFNDPSHIFERHCKHIQDFEGMTLSLDARNGADGAKVFDVTQFKGGI